MAVPFAASVRPYLVKVVELAQDSTDGPAHVLQCLMGSADVGPLPRSAALLRSSEGENIRVHVCAAT